MSSLGASASSSEMLEMITENDLKSDNKEGLKGSCEKLKEKMLLEERLTAAEKLTLEERLGQLATSSTHRSSQILLYKPQNTDVRNNTAGTFEDSSSHKDFSKSIINLKNSGSSTVSRTLQQPTPQVDRGGPPPVDILTILV